MFTRLRLRRANRSPTNKSKKLGSIFRGGKKAQEPLIRPSRTIELCESEDEMELLGGSPLQSNTQELIQPAPQDSFVFSAEELMQNELNHMRQLADKEEKLRNFESAIEELKQNFSTAMTEKDLEIQLNQHLMSNSLDALKLTRDEVEILTKELSFAYEDLSTMEGELLNVKFELEETKEELRIVSKTLMETQHKLHLKDEELMKLKTFAGIGQGVAEGFASFWPF